MEIKTEHTTLSKLSICFYGFLLFLAGLVFLIFLVPVAFTILLVTAFWTILAKFYNHTTYLSGPLNLHNDKITWIGENFKPYRYIIKRNVVLSHSDYYVMGEQVEITIGINIMFLCEEDAVLFKMSCL